MLIIFRGKIYLQLYKKSMWKVFILAAAGVTVCVFFFAKKSKLFKIYLNITAYLQGYGIYCELSYESVTIIINAT